MWRRGTGNTGALLAAAFIAALTAPTSFSGTGVAATAGSAAISGANHGNHALLFHDHAVALQPVKNFAKDALTFEAWISVSDFCHRSAIMSYALNSTAREKAQWVADFNHFVIFDAKSVLACHDFEMIDLWPDPGDVSCAAQFNHHEETTSFVERNGDWHHLAVVWTAADTGLTKIYKDGLLMAEAHTGKTAPLKPGGALMLGGEQDCFGGCTDARQGFYGSMDEVRIWRTARSQEEIVAWMRPVRGLEDHRDLVAYWKFDDPMELGDDGVLNPRMSAADSSGNGNHLPLILPPQAKVMDIQHVESGNHVKVGALSFRNNYAINTNMQKMPTGDFTVSLWARTPGVDDAAPPGEERAELFSYATRLQTAAGSQAQQVFVDDAILIEKYNKEYRSQRFVDFHDKSTVGSVSVHINANRQGNGGNSDHWADYAVGWKDDKWHHITLTWKQASGETHMYWDGEPQSAFWVSNSGTVEVRDPTLPAAVAMASGTTRNPTGSLVLGQNQECIGGCFSPASQLDGNMAAVRVWDRALDEGEVRNEMWAAEAKTKDGLVLEYSFTPDSLKPDGSSHLLTAPDLAGNDAVYKLLLGSDFYISFSVIRSPVTSLGFAQLTAPNLTGSGASYHLLTAPNLANSGAANDLLLGADAPLWTTSDAPLSTSDGAPLPPPPVGAAGHALALHDQQVLMRSKFDGFPDKAITVEFWMLSSDSCRSGTPFSYAAGAYSELDNAFLIFNTQNWGVSVMEDEGTLADHLSGIVGTDGKWHHIAVTWRSKDGQTLLYDNGRLVRVSPYKHDTDSPVKCGLYTMCAGTCGVWSVTRGAGKVIPSGGTLILGREQDCPGGCFDSAKGAKGKMQEEYDQEYGPQDFVGLIDEVRIWDHVRSADEINEGMALDMGRIRRQHKDETPGRAVLPHSRGLVAMWSFDEGTGFVVHDATRGGHDLSILAEPRWVPVETAFALCGNGVVETGEECDDGKRKDGDGCSSTCKVEEGWSCTGTHPSQCVRCGEGGCTTAQTDAAQRGASGGRSRGGSGQHVAIVMLSCIVAITVSMLVGSALWAHRDALSPAWRMVESGLVGLVGRRGRHGGGVDYDAQYAGLTDAEDGLDDAMSPEFLGAAPGPRAGAYSHLPGRS